jgi:hypothetical protein
VQCPSPIGTVQDLRRSVLATVGGRPRTNANETEKETGPGHRPHRSTQDFRKPMLYPLSYEGLRCTFAQHARPVACRWAQAGYLVPHGLCRTYASHRGSASDHRPDTRRRLYGWWWRVILPACGGHGRLSASPGSRSVLRRRGLSVVGHGAVACRLVRRRAKVVMPSAT